MEILKQTEKALFIEVDGTKTWIPKVWYKNGELTGKALDKLEEQKVTDEINESTKKWTFDKAVRAEDVFVEKETEKAILVSQQDPDSVREVKFWIPKSMKDQFWFVEKCARQKGGFLNIR